MSSPPRPRARSRTKDERLRSAAIVKLKYSLLTGKLDKGFQMIFDGVLRDLGLVESEVEAYLESHREELARLCLKDE
jgi:hypothetical protein